MKYPTTRFGEIEIAEDKILSFPEGLYGFENESGFTLLPFDPNIDCPLEWMQSLTTPRLAFVVTDPLLFHPDYRWTLTAEEKRQLEIKAGDEIATRVIVTIPEVYTQMTANFIAPLIINLDKRRVKQVVLTTVEYDTRHFLLPEEARKSGAPV